MARNTYAAKKYRPHKSTIAGLKFNAVYRCDSCGVHQGKKKPIQCLNKDCGSIGPFTFFHSTGEANRYATLLLYVKAGKISDLRTQVRFPLFTINPDGMKQKVCDYVADFEYNDENGKRVVEEFKGGMTDVASLKMRWFKAQYGFEPLFTKG